MSYDNDRKPILTIYTLKDGQKVNVYCVPDAVGPWDTKPMAMAGIKWGRDGGNVVEAYLPADERRYPIYGDKEEVIWE